MNSVISTVHLTKKFLSSEAIHDLTFKVPEDLHFLATSAPTARGKTTTIKTLMNIFVALRQSDFELPGSEEGWVGESTLGLEILVFAEQSLGAVARTFRIEHFRPAEFSLQAWQQRGLLLAPE